jgi:hypothetical protein
MADLSGQASRKAEHATAVHLPDGPAIDNPRGIIRHTLLTTTEGPAMRKMLRKAILFVVLPLALCTTTPAVTCGGTYCGPMPPYSSPPTSGECSNLFNWCMCDCTEQTGGGPCYSACSSWVQGYGCS